MENKTKKCVSHHTICNTHQFGTFLCIVQKVERWSVRVSATGLVGRAYLKFYHLGMNVVWQCVIAPTFLSVLVLFQNALCPRAISDSFVLYTHLFVCKTPAFLCYPFRKDRDEALKVASLNIRGLNRVIKCQNILSFVKNNKIT